MFSERYDKRKKIEFILDFLRRHRRKLFKHYVIIINCPYTDAK